MDKDHLVQEWLAGRLSEEELEEFKKTGDYQQYMEVLRYAKMFKAPEFSPSEHIEAVKERLHPPRIKQRRLWLIRLSRIAAALLIGLVIYYFYPSTKLVNINTAAKEKTTIGLPDASLVTINAGSEISYDRKNWILQRQIRLTGEAYFDVVEGGSFSVITPDWVVNVLGTKFNVKQRDQYFEVQCFEGVVEVSSEQYQKELRAGENLQALDGQISLGTNINREPAWTSNISTFQNTPISEVLAELARQYGVTVVSDDIDKRRLFTGGFVHDNLKDALIAVTEPLNLNYSIDSDQVTITSR